MKSCVAILAVWLTAAFCTAPAEESPPQSAVAQLLEDNAEALLKQLTNPTGDPGEGHLEKTVVFSGASSIKIIPMQRFHPTIPGWNYRIAEKPEPGAYRYLRFAWKADGCAGIMLQLHDAKDWNIRYTAGQNPFNWSTKFVAERPPSEWTVVTRDLFQEFGERTLTGIALTAFGGRAAYFDHIYLGRTIDDLDRIDATGLGKAKPPRLTEGDLDRFWKDLAGEDGALAYRAFWTLVAARKQSVAYLQRKLTAPPSDVTTQQLRQWIRELDDDAFTARENASRNLEKHLDMARVLLEQELDRDPSAEVRRRLEALLGGRKDAEVEDRCLEKAIRALEYMDSPESRTALQELARGPEHARSREAARRALHRLDALPRK